MVEGNSGIAALAVIYAAKSTQDKRGSINTQLQDCCELARREGYAVPHDAVFFDEAASAYKGNRGSGLEGAMRYCETHGAALVVQHSDRLARGDGRASRHLVEYALWALKHDLTILSVQDPQTFQDLLYAVVTGQRNHEDSARKSAATRDGLKRRKESGKPVGPVPEGYTVKAEIGSDGQPITTRLVDDRRMENIVVRAMQMVEDGFTFGDVARRLNSEGFSTRRGKQWRTRAIREIVLNEAYTGSTGYPQVIDRERWERIVASRKRVDPVAVQSRRKGKKPTENYLLRGIASCGHCGAPLWVRRYKRIPGERAYTCSAVRQSTGTCDAEKIPAAPVEKAVIDRLDLFVEDIEQWINERAEEANGAREQFAEAIAGQRRERRKLDLRAQKANELADKLLDEGDDMGAARALRKAEEVLNALDALDEAIASMEAKLADWPAPDVDSALDFYSELQETINGRVKAAKGFEDLQAALRSILAGVALRVAPGGTTIVAHFSLAGPSVEAGKLPALVGAAWNLHDLENPSIATHTLDGEEGTSYSVVRDARPSSTVGRTENGHPPGFTTFV